MDVLGVPPSISLSHTHTLALPYIHPHTHSPTHTLSLTHTLSPTPSHTHTLSLTSRVPRKQLNELNKYTDMIPLKNDVCLATLIGYSSGVHNQCHALVLWEERCGGVWGEWGGGGGGWGGVRVC